MKSFILLAMGLCASIAFPQALSYVPAPRAVYISSDGTGNPGTWEPESGTALGTVSYVPQPVGAYCSNDGTGNEGTWVPCSVGGSGGSVSITSTDGSITFSPSTCTGTCTAIVNRALTLNTLTFTADGSSIIFPNGSLIFEDTNHVLNLVGNASVLLEALSGQFANLEPGDGTNTANIFSVSGISGHPTIYEAVTDQTTAFFAASRANLLNAANTNESQVGVTPTTSGLPGTFAPKFAVGNALIAETEREINSTNGALSAPAKLYNGTPIASGGTGTTTWPLFLLQPNGTTTTGWNTAGTMFGVNAASGFTGNLFDFQTNGSSFLHLSGTGTLSGNSAFFNTYATGSVCASAASPAVCTGAAAGSVVVAATATTVVVDTSRVSAASQILLTFDSSLSTRLGVTCNTAVIQQPTVSARTAGTSFTITVPAAVTTNPDCISYLIVN